MRADLALPRLVLVGEVQDARAYLSDDHSNVSTSLVNTFDLLQAHARVGGNGAAGGPAPEMLLGRFTMELGSGRLIAQEVYRDVTRTFTGIRARWPLPAGAVVTAFGVLPVLTLPDDRQALLHNDVVPDGEHVNLKFLGALYERPRLWLGARGEIYLYVLDEHDEPGKRETRNRELWTVGGRLFRNAAIRRWDGELETVWQQGFARASSAPTDRRDLRVSAGYVHVHTGYTVEWPWALRLGLEYDYGSGDSDPADGKWQRFDTLFGNRRTDLGPTSIYGALGRENVETLGVRLSVAPHARVDAFAVYRVVRLAAAADGFASTGVRDATGQSGRNGGQQVDLRWRVWVVPNAVRLDIGATHLVRGRFLREAPNATGEGDTTYVYGDVTYSFGSQ